jgi:hypothetical protein
MDGCLLTNRQPHRDAMAKRRGRTPAKVSCKNRKACEARFLAQIYGFALRDQ